MADMSFLRHITSCFASSSSSPNSISQFCFWIRISLWIAGTKVMVLWLHVQKARCDLITRTPQFCSITRDQGMWIVQTPSQFVVLFFLKQSWCARRNNFDTQTSVRVQMSGKINNSCLRECIQWIEHALPSKRLLTDHLWKKNKQRALQHKSDASSVFVCCSIKWLKCELTHVARDQ